MAIYHIFSQIFSVSNRTREIKQDPERRAKSVYFGVTSIIFMVLSIACAVGAVFLLSLLLGGNKDAILLLLFTVAGVAACMGGTLTFFVSALIRVIAQLSINRKAIGWIALALFIAGIVAVVIIAVKFLN